MSELEYEQKGRAEMDSEGAKAELTFRACKVRDLDAEIERLKQLEGI